MYINQCVIICYICILILIPTWYRLQIAETIGQIVLLRSYDSLANICTYILLSIYRIGTADTDLHSEVKYSLRKNLVWNALAFQHLIDSGTYSIGGASVSSHQSYNLLWLLSYNKCTIYLKHIVNKFVIFLRKIDMQKVM